MKEETLTDSASVSTSVQDSLPFFMESLDDEDKSKMGHDLIETIPFCTFNGEKCHFEKYQFFLLDVCRARVSKFRDFKLIYDPALGNCFTYNFNATTSRNTFRAGSEYGLSILLQGSQRDYMCTSQTAGFKIIIHDPNEKPFPDAAGYYIGPGTSSNIALKKVSILCPY